MTEPSPASLTKPRLPVRTPEQRKEWLRIGLETAKKKLAEREKREAEREAQKQAFLEESKSKRWIEKMLKG